MLLETRSHNSISFFQMVKYTSILCIVIGIIVAIIGIVIILTHDSKIPEPQSIPKPSVSLTNEDIPTSWMIPIQEAVHTYEYKTAVPIVIKYEGRKNLDKIDYQLRNNIGPTRGWYFHGSAWGGRWDEVMVPERDIPLIKELETNPYEFIAKYQVVTDNLQKPESYLHARITYDGIHKERDGTVTVALWLVWIGVVLVFIAIISICALGETSDKKKEAR